MLEGMASIEARAYGLLRELGADPLTKVTHHFSVLQPWYKCTCTAGMLQEACLLCLLCLSPVRKDPMQLGVRMPMLLHDCCALENARQVQQTWLFCKMQSGPCWHFTCLPQVPHLWLSVYTHTVVVHSWRCPTSSFCLQVSKHTL